MLEWEQHLTSVLDEPCKTRHSEPECKRITKHLSTNVARLIMHETNLQYSQLTMDTFKQVPDFLRSNLMSRKSTEFSKIQSH
jgi:hypothetical protein